MTEKLPNEDAILEALRQQWKRLHASDAVRAGALVELSVSIQRRAPAQVRVVVKSTEHVDDERAR